LFGYFSKLRMETIHIKPISPNEFIKRIKTEQSAEIEKYFEYFLPAIGALSHKAIGPYFWIIPDNHQAKLVFVSHNIGEMTPYKVEEWMNPTNPAEQFASIMHPDDREFIFSSIEYTANLVQNFVNPTNELSINLYGRILDANNNYRWMLMQFIEFYMNENGILLSDLFVFTDISHLNPHIQAMMNVVINDQGKPKFFKIIPEKMNLFEVNIPKLTGREKQIINLMVKGLDTPKISELLNISYHTVQNHKRNLREKTGTKSAAELVNYVLNNNLLGSFI
jgi:DNA-binding CsgD family transcriptional regulator